MMQDTLFSGEATIHEHTYRRTQGPYETAPRIDVGESRWCWSCGSWVNVADVSQIEAFRMTPEELAMVYARKVKGGGLDRHKAYWLFHSSLGVSNFSEAVLLVDIAIGEINSGKGK